MLKVKEAIDNMFLRNPGSHKGEEFIVVIREEKSTSEAVRELKRLGYQIISSKHAGPYYIDGQLVSGTIIKSVVPE